MHKNDLIASVAKLEKESEEEWTVIDREAIKTERVTSYPASYRVIEDTREPGQALVPDRYDVEYLEKVKAKNAYFWAVQYQQDARAREGLVYFNFNQHNIVTEINPDLNTYKFGIDFGAINETIGIFQRDRFGNYTLIDAFQLPNMITEQRAKRIKHATPGNIHEGHGGAASETQQRAEYQLPIRRPKSFP